MNKAHPTKLLEQRYDAVDREVTLGSEYDYCCWELERDPDDQDPDVLTYQDWCTVTALKRFYSMKRSEEVTGNGHKQIAIDSQQSILRAINYIRQKSNYNGEYDFSDSSGVCKDAYNCMNGDLMTKIDVKTQQANVFLYDGRDLNFGLTVASAATKWPYNAMFTALGWALFPPDDIDLALAVLGMAPEVGWLFTGLAGLKTHLALTFDEKRILKEDREIVIAIYNETGEVETLTNIYSPKKVLKLEEATSYGGDGTGGQESYYYKKRPYIKVTDY